MAKRKVTREKMLRGQRAARSVRPAEWGLLPTPVCVCGHYEGIRLNPRS